MKSAALLALFAFLGVTSGTYVKYMENEQENFVGAEVINGTVEKIRKIIAEQDPISVSDLELNLWDVVDLSLHSLKVRGFSDFGFTKLSSSVIRRTLSGTFVLRGVSATVRKALLVADQLSAELTHVDGEVKNISVDFSLSYSLLPTRLRTLSISPRLGNLRGTVDIVVNGNEFDFIMNDGSEIVDWINNIAATYEDAASQLLLELINAILSSV